jgi:hypothetical protein
VKKELTYVMNRSSTLRKKRARVQEEVRMPVQPAIKLQVLVKREPIRPQPRKNLSWGSIRTTITTRARFH